jgi:hypothetical protein
VKMERSQPGSAAEGKTLSAIFQYSDD